MEWRDDSLGEVGQELLLARHVPVDRAGRDAEIGGEPTHRQRRQAVLAKQPEATVEDLVSIQCHPCSRLGIRRDATLEQCSRALLS
jgi:hypothetical protein